MKGSSLTWHYLDDCAYIVEQVHDPPLNHIGLWVDALPEAVEWLTEQGVRFTPGGIRTGAAGYDVVFIHPKAGGDFPYSGQGVLIETRSSPTRGDCQRQIEYCPATQPDMVVLIVSLSTQPLQ